MSSHTENVLEPPVIVLPAGLEELLDPYSCLARIRSLAPVVRAKIGHGIDVWLVTRQVDISKVLGHSGVSVDSRYARDVLDRALRFPELRRHRFYAKDSPEVDRMRRTSMVRRSALRAFRREQVDDLVPYMEGVAGDLTEKIRLRGEGDLVSDFAIPFSLRIMCSILGVPRHDESLIQALTPGLTQWPSSQVAAAGIAESAVRLRAYLVGLVAKKVGSQDGDVLSAMMHASCGHEELDEATVVDMVQVFLVNGYFTAAAMVSNILFEVLRNSRQFADLQVDPSLLPSAVEELLRYAGPTFYAFRYTKAPVEISGITIPAGEVVCLCIASGNRDERVFANADELHLTRQDDQHIAFGHGIHYCVGASLARAEARVALSAILRDLPDLELAARQDELPWQQVIRFVTSLPVRLSTSGTAHAREG